MGGVLYWLGVALCSIGSFAVIFGVVFLGFIRTAYGKSQVTDRRRANTRFRLVAAIGIVSLVLGIPLLALA